MPQFGGTSEKCSVCSKTVYLAEKIVVEDKEDKKTFHKACLQCSHCKRVLSLGNYASMNGVMYCKPHFKQLFATKGNYDEGFGKDKLTSKWAPQAVGVAPTSFIPVDKDEKPASSTTTSSAAAATKSDSPSALASKFGKTSLNTDKCHACDKTVYATEKIVIEEKDGKKNFHKNCLKCNHCSVILSLGNYASLNGVVYCKPHFKQLFAAKGNYDEGFGKEKMTSKWEPQSNSAPSSFIPVDKDEKPAPVSSTKTASPSDVSGRFKGSSSEKCSACNKTVYLTEKIVVEDKEEKKAFHKTCLKCSHCKCVLSLGNYASMNGVMYCKPHFKQLFAAKGNYDEGFGKEKHTRKWQDQDAPEKDEEPHHVRHTENEPIKHVEEPAKRVEEPAKRVEEPTKHAEEAAPVHEEEEKPTHAAPAAEEEPAVAAKEEVEDEEPHHVRHTEDEPIVHKEEEHTSERKEDEDEEEEKKHEEEKRDEEEKDEEDQQ